MKLAGVTVPHVLHKKRAARGDCPERRNNQKGNYMSVAEYTPAPGPYATVVAALENRNCERRGRSDWQCPAHDDRVPSLSVCWDKDGVVKMHCHAGCETSAVLDTLGLAWQDLYPTHMQRRKGKQRLPNLAELERRYRAGTLKIRLKRVPLPKDVKDADGAVRLVYADLTLVCALYRADGFRLPVPYSCRFGAGRLGISYRRVNDATRWLVAHGFLERFALDRRSDQSPTLAYALPLRARKTKSATVAVVPEVDPSTKVTEEPVGVALDLVPASGPSESPLVTRDVQPAKPLGVIGALGVIPTQRLSCKKLGAVGREAVQGERCEGDWTEACSGADLGGAELLAFAGDGAELAGADGSLLAAEQVVAAPPAVADGVEPNGSRGVDQREEVGENIAVLGAVADDGREVLEVSDGLIATSGGAPAGSTPLDVVHGPDYTGGGGEDTIDGLKLTKGFSEVKSRSECGRCGGRSFWSLDPDQAIWTCAKCHPPARDDVWWGEER